MARVRSSSRLRKRALVHNTIGLRRPTSVDWSAAPKISVAPGLTGVTSMRESIFTDGFFKGLDRSVGDVNVAEALPPACYADPQFYEFEKEAIFNHEWLCVGHEAWVK